jgi:hypothetical protein
VLNGPKTLLRPRIFYPQFAIHIKARRLFFRSHVPCSIISLRLLLSPAFDRPRHCDGNSRISVHLPLNRCRPETRLTEIRFIRTPFILHSSSSSPYHFRSNSPEVADELYCSWDAHEEKTTAPNGISIAPTVHLQEAK